MIRHLVSSVLQARLMASGHVVAICEQAETPVQAKARGASMLKREVQNEDASRLIHFPDP